MTKKILPVDGIDGEPGAEKAAITAVTFIGKWIALCCTAHHVVQMENISFRSSLPSICLIILIHLISSWLNHRHGCHHNIITTT